MDVLKLMYYDFEKKILDTSEEVVNNLPEGLKTIVNLILVVKALLSYPLPYYAACELLEKELFMGKPDTRFPTIWSLDGELKVWGLGMVLYKISIIAIFAHKHFYKQKFHLEI